MSRLLRFLMKLKELQDLRNWDFLAQFVQKLCAYEPHCRGESLAGVGYPSQGRLLTDSVKVLIGNDFKGLSNDHIYFDISPFRRHTTSQPKLGDPTQTSDPPPLLIPLNNEIYPQFQYVLVIYNSFMTEQSESKRINIFISFEIKVTFSLNDSDITENCKRACVILKIVNLMLFFFCILFHRQQSCHFVRSFNLCRIST